MLLRLTCAAALTFALVGCGASDAAQSGAATQTSADTSAPATIATAATVADATVGSDAPSDPATDAIAAVVPATAAEGADGADRVELGSTTSSLPDCPAAPRGAVADKVNQRYWLCMDGQAVTDQIPMTTASSNYGLPPVGTYDVFARDQHATGINGEPLERFVAFYTTPTGNRIAFHQITDQDPATVGDLDHRGASSGCFRVREHDSVQVWDFLQIGDPVVITSN